MSDIEHELVVDVAALKDQLREVAELAHRSLAVARAEQTTARGNHDAWLDDATTTVNEILGWH